MMAKLFDWRHTSVTGWGTVIAFAVASAQFIFGTWLVLLLPLYLFVRFARYYGAGPFAPFVVLWAARSSSFHGRKRLDEEANFRTRRIVVAHQIRE